MAVQEFQAKLIAATFGLALADVTAHIFGRIRLTIEAGEWTVLTFASQLDAEASQALLAAQRIYSLRSDERVGSRLWIRWEEVPDPGVARAFFERLLGRRADGGGFDYRIAVEGETLAPLQGGGSVFGPDSKPASFLPQGPHNRLSVLARKL